MQPENHITSRLTSGYDHQNYCQSCGEVFPKHLPLVGGSCQKLACRQAMERQRLLHQVAEYKQQIEQRDERLLALQKDSIEVAGNAAVLKIPFQDITSESQSSAPREIFLEHITHLMETLEQPERKFKARLDTVVKPQHEAYLAKACGSCRGYCCVGAKDFNSFIQRDTLRRVLTLYPELDTGDVETTTHALQALYQQYFPAVAIPNACVFQGEKGCTLIADLRADLCGDYFCEALDEFVEQNPVSVPSQILMVGVDGPDVGWCKVVDDQGGELSLTHQWDAISDVENNSNNNISDKESRSEDLFKTDDGLSF